MALTTDGYFRLFGIKKVSDISKYELKRRYRKLALRYHPDRSRDNGAKFKEVHKAYEYIGDRLIEFLKEDDKKFFNSDFHFYGDGSIYNIKDKRWVRLKDQNGEWINLKQVSVRK